MKKFIRTAILVFALTVLCFSLSGCHALDELRNTQAFRNDDGTISYNGQIYKALPHIEEFEDLFFAFDDIVYITDKDVPVLMTFFFGTAASMDKNATVIRMTGSNETFFCREDMYDNLLEEIKNPQYTKYKLQIDTWGYYIPVDEEIPKNIALTDAETAAIEEVIKLNDTIEFSDKLYDYDSTTAEISRYTEDELFSESYCTIVKRNDMYYVVISGSEAIDDYGDPIINPIVCKVPTSGETAAKIQEIIDKKIKIDEKLRETYGSYYDDSQYDPDSYDSDIYSLID